MKYRIYAAIVIAATALTACSPTEAEGVVDPVEPSTRVTLLGNGTQDVSVYAFRLKDGSFFYDTLFCGDWTADGRLPVNIANGSYKFLFACGEGGSLTLQPEPLTRQTTWEQALFTLGENPELPGTYLPSDELFLQYPASEASRVYVVGGSNMTVSATLTRAVSQIGINVKRGYYDGTRYVEVPYGGSHSVLDEIDRIELTAHNAGLSVSPGGSAGTATVVSAFRASEQGIVTGEGFASFDGPFVIPPADDADMRLGLKVVPKEGSSMRPATLELTGRAERNKRLDITLWITSANPTIGVEIETAPIEQEQEGDSGIWE